MVSRLTLASRAGRFPSKPFISLCALMGPQRRGAASIVDNYGSQQDVVQKASPLVEKSDQQDKWREEGHCEPESDGMYSAKDKISRGAVPSAHFQVHQPHPDGGRVRTAKRRTEIQQRPDNGRRRQKPVKREAKPQGDDPE